MGWFHRTKSLKQILSHKKIDFSKLTFTRLLAFFFPSSFFYIVPFQSHEVASDLRKLEMLWLNWKCKNVEKKKKKRTPSIQHLLTCCLWRIWPRVLVLVKYQGCFLACYNLHVVSGRVCLRVMPASHREHPRWAFLGNPQLDRSSFLSLPESLRSVFSFWRVSSHCSIRRHLNVLC